MVGRDGDVLSICLSLANLNLHSAEGAAVSLLLWAGLVVSTSEGRHACSCRSETVYTTAQKVWSERRYVTTMISFPSSTQLNWVVRSL